MGTRQKAAAQDRENRKRAAWAADTGRHLVEKFLQRAADKPADSASFKWAAGQLAAEIAEFLIHVEARGDDRGYRRAVRQRRK